MGKKYTLNEDCSYHGSSCYPEVIEILGDDCKVYNNLFDKEYDFVNVGNFYEYCLNQITIILDDVKLVERLIDNIKQKERL